MAKLSRSHLKKIVKECLVEILSEGIGTTVKNSRNRVTPPRPAPPSTPKTNPRSQILDSIRFTENVKNSVGVLTGDPMMASIFEDTATGTLQEQINAEHVGESDSMSYGDSPSEARGVPDPLKLFGEASQNWATLAFNDKKIK
jgi:hypothetical protein